MAARPIVRNASSSFSPVSSVMAMTGWMAMGVAIASGGRESPSHAGFYCHQSVNAASCRGGGAVSTRPQMVEDSYGDDVLNLVVARGYLAKLLKNPNVARYLERHQADIARELQGLIETIGQEHTGDA